MAKYCEVYETIRDVTPGESKEIVDTLIKSLRLAPGANNKEPLAQLKQDLKANHNPTNLHRVFFGLVAISSRLSKELKHVALYYPRLLEVVEDINSKTSQGRTKLVIGNNQGSGKGAPIDKDRLRCDTCGKIHRGVCRFAGKRKSDESTDKAGKKNKPNRDGKPCNTCYINTLQHPTTDSISDHTISMILMLPKGTKEACVLLDTGATSSNYICSMLLDEAIALGLEIQDSSRIVCSGLGECKKSLGNRKSKFKIYG